MALDPKSRLARFIRFVMRDVRFHKQYPCTVQAQSGQTLDLKPDDESLEGLGLGAVPLRVGLPGWEIEVPQGARVMLSFDEGDPSKPAAALFDPKSVTKITYADGSQPVGRLGDLVVSGGLGTTVTFSSLLGLPIGAPPNNAMVVGVPYLVSFSLVAPTLTEADPLYGSVASGREEMLA